MDLPKIQRAVQTPVRDGARRRRRYEIWRPKIFDTHHPSQFKMKFWSQATRWVNSSSISVVANFYILLKWSSDSDSNTCWTQIISWMFWFKTRYLWHDNLVHNSNGWRKLKPNFEDSSRPEDENWRPEARKQIEDLCILSSKPRGRLLGPKYYGLCLI